MQAFEYIRDHELIVDIYGVWPTFHDSEIVDFRGTLVGTLGPGTDDEAVFELTIHCYLMNSDVNDRGNYVTYKHNIVTFRFEDISEWEMRGFQFQNCIDTLTIKPIQSDDLTSETLIIEISSSYGLSGRFKCSRAEVRSIIPYPARG